MSSFLQKLRQHFRRVAKARRLGVTFTRRATFALPSRLRWGANSVVLAYPNEPGVDTDFLGCFIDDEYGLAHIDGPVRTIVDIGANVGFFSVAARMKFPSATIHAYEPNLRIASCLTTNARTLNFQPFLEAVGAAAGFIAIEDPGISNQVRTVTASATAPQIPQVSLATVVERLGGRIDLAKIDCEGAEWEMFTDPAPWRCIRLVRMEYHLWRQHTYAEVEAALRRLGFEIHHHVGAPDWGTVWCRRTA